MLRSCFALVCCLLIVSAAIAQRSNPAAEKALKLPEVLQIDDVGLKKLLVPAGKPLLVNFWATWCEPCREEFPDLVILRDKYEGKLDVVTVSLDEASEIATTVPKFLSSMKADMPAYLLKTPDEGAAISMIAKDWQGGLPFTLVFDGQGNKVYTRQGKIKLDVVISMLDTLFNPAAVH